MRNRYTQHPKHWEYTSQQLVRFARRKQGDSLWCSPNRGDNQRGHLAKWGKKVAKKNEYITGKHRNDNKFKWARVHHGYRVYDYQDAHYWGDRRPHSKWRKNMKTTKGDMQEILDGVVREINRRHSGLSQQISDSLNKKGQQWASSTTWIGGWEKSNGDEGQAINWDVYIIVRRKQANRIYSSD